MSVFPTPPELCATLNEKEQRDYDALCDLITQALRTWEPGGVVTISAAVPTPRVRRCLEKELRASGWWVPNWPDAKANPNAAVKIEIREA